jgi:hypothetical protein
MKLTEEQRGKIAYAILKRQFAKDGIRFALLRRMVGNQAEEVGCKPEELMALAEHITYELAMETFSPRED